MIPALPGSLSATASRGEGDSYATGTIRGWELLPQKRSPEIESLALNRVLCPRMKSLSDCLLYTFVDTAYLRGRSPEAVAQELCDGGSDLIQLRAKDSTADDIRRMAEAILPVTRRAGVGLVINDHPAIASEVGAEYCHLGQEDFFGESQGANIEHRIEEKKKGLTAEDEDDYDRSGNIEHRTLNAEHPMGAGDRPTGTGLGLSTHRPEQAERALAAKPDYIAIGPVYATGTKPGAKPVTLDYVRWAAANVSIPWFAIGGINRQNLGDVLAAGAQRICVVSAILNAPDIAQACREFRENILRLRK